MSTEFLANLDAAIERLNARGIRPAALLLDAGFTSDGMFVAPPGCLAGAAERIRKAGGVYIADEVQAGFARFGEALWGFELHDIAPDIVTLGKPIGNGHPLSATIVRSEILDVFSSRGRYFNTFGGNPVAAAVGLAVLDVFENEALAVIRAALARTCMRNLMRSRRSLTLSATFVVPACSPVSNWSLIAQQKSMRQKEQVRSLMISARTACSSA